MPKKYRAKIPKQTNKNQNIQKKDSINKILVENFVGIQRVMAELSEKFEKLSKQLSELLNLFEESAKTLVKKEFEIVKESPNIELNSKLDKLLDQNKIIARGLTMVHERTAPAQTTFYPQQQYKEEIRKPIMNKPEDRLIKKPLSIEKEDEDKSPPVFEIP
jgi:hypothetical protein